GGVGLELDPDLAPGDGEVGVVPGGLGEVADGVDQHQRDRPAAGVVLAAQPAVFQVPVRQAVLGELRGDLGLGVDVRLGVGHRRLRVRQGYGACPATWALLYAGRGE